MHEKKHRQGSRSLFWYAASQIIDSGDQNVLNNLLFLKFDCCCRVRTEGNTAYAPEPRLEFQHLGQLIIQGLDKRPQATSEGTAGGSNTSFFKL